MDEGGDERVWRRRIDMLWDDRDEEYLLASKGAEIDREMGFYMKLTKRWVEEGACGWVIWKRKFTF